MNKKQVIIPDSSSEGQKTSKPATSSKKGKKDPSTKKLDKTDKKPLETSEEPTWNFKDQEKWDLVC
jgi:hypothetical protein